MHTLASGLEGGCVLSYSLLLAGSSACALRYGPAPRGRAATGKARPAWGARLTNHPTEGGVSGAGPERLYPGPRPGQAQIPAAKTMAAAALRQVGSRPGSGELLGEAHFRVDHSPVAHPMGRRSSRTQVPLQGAKEEGAP